jgi:hypothetical protein
LRILFLYFLKKIGYYRSGHAVVTLFFCMNPSESASRFCSHPRKLSGVRQALAAASAATAQKIYQMACIRKIRSPAVAGLRSRFVKSRPFIGRSRPLVFVDVSFGGKGKMKGLAKSGQRMSPWRCKKTIEIMSVACSFKSPSNAGRT